MSDIQGRRGDLARQWFELGGPFGRVNGLLYEAVHLQVSSVLPELERDKAHTARQICGESFWRRLGNGDRRRAGMCLRDIVNCGSVELTHVFRKSKYPRKYRLK